ncbi:hypothetical protein BIFGAL_03495 [Bifidobacterium gallicum DSM 20093 = LMG 11596]|uniref:Uncharacterized protein n=1 Tax=Bifidobacterium gallicum DSM 20093 = LMG 11596 TaxID=561180 RepID=D1NUH2_9BIFI|nr:hypothetical protein BIFGAL_03495 [Bifidobacterium gallicum DSM 20093 = LMG 11596]
MRLSGPAWSGKPHFWAGNCVSSNQSGQENCSFAQTRIVVVPAWYRKRYGFAGINRCARRSPRSKPID